jgi:hypothetical protein
MHELIALHAHNLEIDRDVHNASIRMVVFGWTVFWLMAGIETVRTISHNKPAEPAEAEANSNQISGPTYMYQDAIQSKKKKNGAN